MSTRASMCTSKRKQPSRYCMPDSQPASRITFSTKHALSQHWITSILCVSSNMVLRRNDDILLSDFGIALIAQSTQSQSIQAMAGTMNYMAPEQLHGRPRYASDQYSLAIVIYEWLTGERPFQGTFTELASQHMFATPPPLYVKLPGISPDVEQVIMTALSKDPQRRFGSIRAFAHALEQVSHSDQPFLFPQPPASFTFPAGNEGSSLMLPPTLADSMSHTPPNTFIPEALHTPVL